MEIDKNDMPKIDKAFRKAMLAPEESSDEAMALWENGLAKKVAWQNFFKFGFTHFNVFTIATIASVAVVALSTTYYIVNSAAPIASKEKGLPRKEAWTDSAIHTQHPSVSDQNSPVNKNYSEQADTSIRLNSTTVTDLQVDKIAVDSVLLPVEKKTESMPTEILPITQNRNENKVKPVKIVKKTILIEKQDTLETVDTIRSKKEWKKATKNK